MLTRTLAVSLLVIMPLFAHADELTSGKKADEVVGRMLKKPATERLKLLRNAEGAEPRFLWAIIRDQLHYAAVHLHTVAETARDIDLALRWGFGMKQGPFELWQEAGWSNVANMIQADIDAGKALCKEPLPAWVFNGPVAEAGGVHTPQGSWNPSTGQFVLPRSLPVMACIALYPRLWRRVMDPRVRMIKQAPVTANRSRRRSAA